MTRVTPKQAPPPGFRPPFDEAPNLDDFSFDPEDMEHAADVFARYAHYLRLRALAGRQRAAGRVEPANRLQAAADEEYRSLPDWARW